MATRPLIFTIVATGQTDKTNEHNTSAFGRIASKRLLGELTLSLPSNP